MSGAGLTVRVLRTAIESADGLEPPPGGDVVPGIEPSLDSPVTSVAMLEALIATDFDLPGAIVRVVRGD